MARIPSSLTVTVAAVLAALGGTAMVPARMWWETGVT